jgi:hypothetical protein
MPTDAAAPGAMPDAAPAATPAAAAAVQTTDLAPAPLAADDGDGSDVFIGGTPDASDGDADDSDDPEVDLDALSEATVKTSPSFPAAADTYDPQGGRLGQSRTNLQSTAG